MKNILGTRCLQKTAVFFSAIVMLTAGILSSVSGQAISISGTVKNRASGAVLPGANVLLEGYPDLITISDQNGNFSLAGTITGTIPGQHTPWDFRAYAMSRGIMLNVPFKSPVRVQLYALNGKIAASLERNDFDKGQWLFSPRLAPGLYICRTGISGHTSTFKFQQMAVTSFHRGLTKICDLNQAPNAQAKTAAATYTLAVSKSRYMPNRLSLSTGSQQNVIVNLDSIQLMTGMTETQTRDALRNLIGTDSVVFIKRFTLDANHYYQEHAISTWKPGGSLCILNLKDGTVGTIIKDAYFSGGVFKRFDVSYDAKKIVFDFKKGAMTGFRLYEADIATGTVKQLTFPQANEDSLIRVYQSNATQCYDSASCNTLYHHGTDDVDPCYLPDGGVAFVSTRCQVGTPCDAGDAFTTTNMYRIDGDGSNLRRLSKGMASEFTPSMMPDGRIMYSRWEYVDKASAAAKCQWSMFPNGAGSAEIYGNDITQPNTLVQGRVIPGAPNKYVVLGTPHCCPQGQYGTVVMLDMNKYIRSRLPMEYITKEVEIVHDITDPMGYAGYWWDPARPADNGNLYRDPCPLAEDLYLVSFKPGSVSKNWSAAKGYGLYVLGGDGKSYRFYRDTAISCWMPVPLQPRPREPAASIPLDPTLAAQNQAVCTVNDIYYNMENVPRGSIKYIRVLAQIPRPWTARHWWGGDAYGLAHAAVERNTALGLKVQFGIVPVESDGSANFVVPANECVFFDALDSNFTVVQHERTFVNFMPGERRGCTGCHETPDQVPPVPGTVPIALRRSPSVPGPQPGDTTGKILLDFPSRVQPVLDKHCIKCHNPTDNKGNLDLTGSITTLFTTSYDKLMDRRDWLLGWYVDEEPRTMVQTTQYIPAYSMYSNCILLKILGGKVTLQDRADAPTYCAKWSSQYGATANTLTANHSTRFTLTREEYIRVANWVQSNLQFRGSYWGRFNSGFDGLADFRPSVTFEQAIGTEVPKFGAVVIQPDTLWYKFNETSGATAADACAKRNGTLTGGATWTTGKAGNAVSFNGSGAYVSAPAFGACSSFTVAGWVKPNALTNQYSAFMHTDGWQSGCVHIHIGTGGAVSWGIFGADPINQVSTSTIAVGAWSHVAIVYDGGAKSGRIYINGVLSGTQAYTVGATIILNGMRIGSWSGGGRDLNGAIDDFRVYKTALTAAQVLQLYNNPQ